MIDGATKTANATRADVLHEVTETPSVASSITNIARMRAELELPASTPEQVAERAWEIEYQIGRDLAIMHEYQERWEN